MEFCEQFETLQLLENKEGNSTPGSGSSKVAKQQKKKTIEGSNSSNKNMHKWCHLHQTDTHDFNECKIMKEQAKRMRLAYANRDPSQIDKEKRVKHHNKKQELSIMIDKAFKEHFHKMVKKSQRKNRKQEFNLIESLCTSAQTPGSGSDSDNSEHSIWKFGQDKENN